MRVEMRWLPAQELAESLELGHDLVGDSRLAAYPTTVLGARAAELLGSPRVGDLV